MIFCSRHCLLSPMFLGFLALLFIVVTRLSAGQTSFCTACHASTRSWLQGKGAVLSRWMKEKDPREMGHHFWFDKDFLSLLKEQDCAFPPGGEESYYRRLSGLLESPLDPARKRALLRSLIDRGRREVPGFEDFWSWGEELLHRGELERESIHSFVKALQEPYGKLHLQKGEQFSYWSSYRVHVGKVLFIFGGVNKESHTQSRFEVKDRLPEGYEMKTSFGLRGRAPVLHADFSIAPNGDLRSIGSYNPREDHRLKNLARFFERGGGERFGKFSFDKKIFLKRRSNFTRKVVEVRLDVTIDAMEEIEGKPCLFGSFSLEEKPDGRGDGFSLWGRGRFVHLPRGLVAAQEMALRFRVKLLGIPFVKGSVLSRSWLAPEESPRLYHPEKLLKLGP